MKASCAILLLCTVFLAPPIFADNDYGEGYQRGYQKGYQYQKDGGIEPIAPIAPIPPIPKIGESDYDDGYRRGIIEGYEKKQGQGQRRKSLFGY